MKLCSILCVIGYFTKTFSFQANYHLPIMVCAGYIISQWRQTESLRKSAQEEAELNEKMLLQARLTSHVVANSLSTILGVNRRNPEEGNACLHHMACFYRKVTDASERDDFTFIEEKGLIDDYLFMEKKRIGEKLKITYDWDNSLNHYILPALIVQTLIENAIKHGVSTCVTGGDVSIRLCQSETHAIIEIKNTGTPLSLTEKHGIGLSNLRARLEYAYENGASLSLDASEGWTVAKIDIDKNFIKEKHEKVPRFQTATTSRQMPSAC